MPRAPPGRRVGVLWGWVPVGDPAPHRSAQHLCGEELPLLVDPVVYELTLLELCEKRLFFKWFSL
jgi:hypothetical protein